MDRVAKTKPFSARYNLRWLAYTFLACLVFVAVLSGTVSVVFAPAGGQHSIYKGQAVFDTPQDYADFKELLAQPEVIITSYTELSRDYPVLVSYDVDIPSDITFSYSEAVMTFGGTYSVWRKATFVIVLLACVVFLVYSSLKSLRKIA